MNYRKLLFVSPIQPIGGCSANVYSWNKTPSGVRIAMSFLNHPGLSFLKANLPCEILEYPTQEQYQAALLDPPDVVAISFYINETEIALRMASEARRRGVKEVWAGNFGAYSPQIESSFDRIFKGWGESQVAQVLGLEPISVNQLNHPEMYGAIGTNLFPKMVFSGILFTSRGCPWTCNFCQTPEFYGKAGTLPLETIDQVLWKYSKNGIKGINILDENFGTFQNHAKEVVDLLHKYGFRWIALTRVDTLLKNFDYWQSRGLFGAHLGIESLNQSSLVGASKRIQQMDSIQLLKKLQRYNMFIQCFYILGFEEDTVKSIRHDIEVLAGLNLDVVQVQVLTPYPRTEQRQIIEEKYGINDFNLSKYNSRNLVWNHPNISPEEMRSLQEWASRRLTSSQQALRTLSKFAVFCGQEYPNLDGLRLILSPFYGAAKHLDKCYSSQLLSARKWAKVGWYPYEEFPQEASITASGTSISPFQL